MTHPEVKRIFDRRAAIRNTVVYALAFLGAVVLVFWSTSVWGRVGAVLAILWSIGGLQANIRAIANGFIVDDEDR